MWENVLRGTMGCIMTIQLYKNASDNATLDKDITSVATLDNVLLLEPSSVMSPIFKISMDLDITAFNYLYCAEFDRFYYITNIAAALGGLYELSCEVDVLMSYKGDILQTSGIINRGGTKFNPLIVDNYRRAQVDATTVNKVFSGGELLSTITAENKCFVLITYGGIV